MKLSKSCVCVCVCVCVYGIGAAGGIAGALASNEAVQQARPFFIEKKIHFI